MTAQTLATPTVSSELQLSLAIVHGRVDARRRWTMWLTAEVPEADVVADFPSWLDLLADTAFPPDVVLLFPADDAVPVSAKVAALGSGGSAVIVVAPHAAWSLAPVAMAAGAHAIVTPTTRPEHLRELLRVLGTDDLRRPAPLTVVPDPATPIVARPRLSEQERRALVLYVSGDKLAAVAHQLGLRYDTAKSYLDRVRAKYDRAGRPARTKLDLYHRAVEDGLV
jgi:hypothetical protein